MANEQQKYAAVALGNTIAFAGEKIRVGEKTYDGIVEDMLFDEIVVAGGNGESGGFKAVIPISDFAEQPKQLDEIEARGKVLQILSINVRNGIACELSAGDPSTE
jgi:hypothetical protein